MADDEEARLARLEREVALSRRDEAWDATQKMTERQFRPEYADKLRRAAQEFFRQETFEVGQLVRWKPGLKNRRFPSEGAPAVILEMLEGGLETAARVEDSASGYFREHLTLALGILSDDDELLVWWFDGRRFEPFD